MEGKRQKLWDRGGRGKERAVWKAASYYGIYQKLFQFLGGVDGALELMSEHVGEGAV